MHFFAILNIHVFLQLNSSSFKNIYLPSILIFWFLMQLQFKNVSHWLQLDVSNEIRLIIAKNKQFIDFNNFIKR